MRLVAWRWQYPLFFNKSVAKIYEYVNLLSSLVSKKSIVEDELSKIIENLTVVIHPFLPHLSEEIWHSLGNTGLAVNQSWPKIDKVVKDQVYKLVIQINGKIKDLIEVKEATSEDILVQKIKKIDKIKNAIAGKTIIKTIYVPNKIINFVIK